MFSEMEQESIQQGLPTLGEASARQRHLQKGVDAPDLATVKDFIRSHATASRGKIVDLLTAYSVNTLVLCLLHPVTGTPIDDEDRDEVYNMSNQQTYMLSNQQTYAEQPA